MLFAFNHVPVLGGVLMYSSSARYSHTMSMLLDSGVDIIRAAKISADASGSPLIKLDSDRITKELREGRYFNEILNGSLVYPPLLTDMVQVGDESGRMAGMLAKCGEKGEMRSVWNPAGQTRASMGIKAVKMLGWELVEAGATLAALAPLLENVRACQ